MEFEKMLEQHLKLFKKVMDDEIKVLEYKKENHDRDKLDNKIVNEVYIQHFPRLKSIKFGTQEYFDYERKYFDKAHEIHAQNDHHFYSNRNTKTEPTLLDLLEAIIDIYVSNKQYDKEEIEVDEFVEILRKKKIFDYELEEFVTNTIKEIKSNDGDDK